MRVKEVDLELELHSNKKTMTVCRQNTNELIYNTQCAWKVL